MQYCGKSNKFANQIKKELTDKAISIRNQLKKDIRIVNHLLRSFAASEFNFRKILEGKERFKKNRGTNHKKRLKDSAVPCLQRLLIKDWLEKKQSLKRLFNIEGFTGFELYID